MPQSHPGPARGGRRTRISAPMPEQPSSRRTLRLVLGGLLLHALVAPAPAHAYLDAGSGSLIVQALLAGVVGVGTVLRLYWGRIRSLLSRNGKQKSTHAGDASQG